MDEQRIHELAVAYAQIKLLNYQEELKKKPDYSPFKSNSEEIYQFVKAYQFALDNIEVEHDDVG